LGAVGNALTHDHVLLMGARQQTKWSGGRGRHSEPSGDLVLRCRESGNPRNHPFGPSFLPVVAAVAATLAG